MSKRETKRSAEPVADKSYRLFYDYYYDQERNTTAPLTVVISDSHDFDAVDNDHAIAKAKRYIAAKNRQAREDEKYKLLGVSRISVEPIYQAREGKRLRTRVIQVG